MGVADTGGRRAFRGMGDGLGPVDRRQAMGCIAAAALSAPRPAKAQGASFRFGLTPVFLTSDLALLEGLQTYLADRIGVGVQLVLRRTYQEITSELVANQLDAAWICGYPFVAYRDQLTLVAVPRWRGGHFYQSYLIAASNRIASGLPDLAGDVHAFSDPDSNSGYLVTRAQLAARGSRPENFFARSFFTYGHRNVVRAVASGLAQSGSVDGYVWEVLSEVEPELAARTRIVWRSEWMGFPPVATGAGRAQTQNVARLRDALLSMAERPDGRAILHMLRLDGFGAADMQIFDGIAGQVEAVRRAG